MVIHWPKAQLMAQSWAAGEGLPQWTPLILSGMPLTANQLAMLSYPPAWLFLILPTEPTFNLLFIFHLLLGGIGINLLLRERYKLSPAAAFLGSLTFVLNGKWLAHMAGGHVSMVGAIGWIPWVLFGLTMLLQADEHLAKQQGSRQAGEQGSGRALLRSQVQGRSLNTWGWIVLTAFGFAMQIVTHTLIFIYTIYFSVAVVVWHYILISCPLNLADRKGLLRSTSSDTQPRSHTERGNEVGYHPVPVKPRFIGGTLTGAGWTRFYPEIKRLFFPLLLIPILAALLGAGQLLPLLELVEFSNRSLNLVQAAEYSVTPTQLFIGLLLPSAQGGHDFVIYLGLIPLVLAPFGLTRRNRWTWFYGGVLIFAVLFALGPSTPVHAVFYYFVPGFRWVRTPARIFFVGSAALAVLVGFSADRLAAVHWSSTFQKGITRTAVALGALALMLGLGLAFGFGHTSRATFALAIFVPLGLSLIVLRVRSIISAHLALTLLGIALFLDLASFDRSMMQFLPLAEATTPGRPAAEYLAQKAGYFRIYSPSYSLPMQTAAAHNLHLADGVEPVHLAIYDRYMARAGGYNDSSFSVTIPNFAGGTLETALKDVEPDLKLLGLLNVKYLASAFPMSWPGLSLEAEVEGTYIYTNERALPRARVVHQTVPTEPDWLAQLENLPDVANVVTVETSPQLVGTSAPASTATITHYSADLIKIETEISKPGWLVLSEIWYPGWRATVNGSLKPVEKVNGLLRGLYLGQPGTFQILMEYHPKSVVWSSWIAGITAALLILISLIMVFGSAYYRGYLPYHHD
jgi:hypothetical protein